MVVFQAKSRASDLNRAVNADIFKRLARRRRFAVGLVVLLLCGLGWAVYTHWPLLFPPLKPDNQTPVSSQKENLPTDGKSNKGQTTLSDPAANIAQQNDKILIGPIPAPALKPAAPPTTNSPPAPPKVVMNQVKAKAQKQTKVAPKTAPAGDVKKLDLQAIAWNQDVAQRLAVINNRIVHVGDSVAGLKVVSIAPQHVTVTDDEHERTLKFVYKP